ncbi:MAG: phosphatidylglycerol lysyltransferase domain-containing protein [Eubacteriales bacterium]
MLNFYYPKLNDKLWVKELLSNSQYMGCEYSFGNMFIWSPIYNTKITRYKDFLITKSEGKTPSYCCPAGKGDVKSTFLELFKDAERCGHPFRMFGLSKECVVTLDEMFPNKFVFEPYRDGFDYIYLTEDLINLAGQKYHGKRNHIAAFKKSNSWSFEMINDQNIKECIKMNSEWESDNREKNPKEIDEELKAINLAFENYFDLDFIGALIRVEGKPVAFTLGEKLNDNTFCTHVEKAYADIRGAYPMINREFAANALSGYKYVNREEDTGSEGLRKAKLSYGPAILLEKYTVVCRGEI